MVTFQVRGKQNDSVDDGEETRVRSKSIHYLASQFLADSSLSADVSQFDFTSSPASVSNMGSVLGRTVANYTPINHTGCGSGSFKAARPKNSDSPDYLSIPKTEHFPYVNCPLHCKPELYNL